MHTMYHKNKMKIISSGRKHLLKLLKQDGTETMSEKGILETAREFYVNLYKANIQ